MSARNTSAADSADTPVGVVTGAGQGIGEATAVRLAEDGVRVAVIDSDPLAAHRTAASINHAGGEAAAFVADVTDRGQVQSAVADVVDRFGRLDILVNKAGVTRDDLFFRMKEEDWELVLRTHLDGAFFCTQAAQQHMVAAKRGKIVFLSSSSALGNRGQSNYSVAKAGLQGLTRTLALELGPMGITVNAVAPGFIATPMTRAITERTGASWEELVERAASRTAVRRIGQPEDVANLIAFLVGPQASFISGQTIYVTGGPAGQLG
jgi:3-oxoacyl-[acyl-carrier protein] reductase